MAAPGTINRTQLQSNYQNAGDTYDDNKTEGAMNYLADQMDANWAYVASLVSSGALAIYPYDLIPFNLPRQSIINGGMEVVNEGTSFTIATATSRYTVEMFKSANNGSGANATASQVAVTDLDGASFGLQIVHAALPSAQAQLMEFYTVEARDAYKMAGQQRTVSVKVKAVAGMDRATLKAKYKTSESAITDASTLIASGSAIAINSSGWTTLTLTYTVPAKATLTSTGVIGFEVVGSKTTSEASGDGFIIAQWQDNLGAAALPFQPLGFDAELGKTLRYFEKSYAYDVAPGTASVLSNIVTKVVPSNTIAIGQNYGSVNYLVRKRTNGATITIYPYATPANTGRVSDTGGVDLGAGSGLAGTNGDYGFSVRNNSGGTLTVGGSAVMFHFTSDARL